MSAVKYDNHNNTDYLQRAVTWQVNFKGANVYKRVFHKEQLPRVRSVPV